MKNLGKNFFLVIIIFLVISVLFATFAKPFEQPETVTISKLAAEIEEGLVSKIEVSGNKLQVHYKDESEKESLKEVDAAFTETLLNLGVSKEKLAEVEIESKKENKKMKIKIAKYLDTALNNSKTQNQTLLA